MEIYLKKWGFWIKNFIKIIDYIILWFVLYKINFYKKKFYVRELKR